MQWIVFILDIALSPRSIGLRGVHIYVRKYLRAMLDCGEIAEISELKANHYQNWFKMLHSVLTRTVQYIGSNVEEKAESKISGHCTLKSWLQISYALYVLSMQKPFYAAWHIKFYYYIINVMVIYTLI